MSNEHTEAEDTLRRLWGKQPRPKRGPKAALSVELIVEAAGRVADADGLAAVSMARVAEELGYSPMALYRHVTSKDELLVLMADRIAPHPPELPYGTGWREGLEIWVRAQVEMAVERPWFLELPLTATPFGPNRLRWLDAGMRLMRDLDLGFGDKLEILGLLAQHVLGEARVEVETRRAAAARVRADTGVDPGTPESELDPRALDAANPYYDFELVLSQLATPEEYPDIFAAAAGWQEEPPAEPDAESGFGLGLRFMLDGIEAYVARRVQTKGG
jgi:AcrR family transcriptional regulator